MSRSLSTGLLWVLVFVVLGTGPSFAQVSHAWTLVWADEFEQADGAAPDSSQWVYDFGGKGWGNQSRFITVLDGSSWEE